MSEFIFLQHTYEEFPAVSFIVSASSAFIMGLHGEQEKKESSDTDDELVGGGTVGLIGQSLGADRTIWRITQQEMIPRKNTFMPKDK